MATYYSDSGMGGPRRFSLFPPMIKALLVSNIAVFLLEVLAGSLTFNGVSLGIFIEKYLALHPLGGSMMGGYTGQFYPWQLLTFQFLHGDFMHLFFNMFALWMFGVELEAVWGSRRFLVYYLLSGVGAAIVHMVVSPLFAGSAAPMVGASGGVYAVLLAFGLTFPNRPIIMFPILFPIPARFFVMIYAAIELVAGLTSTNSRIAHFAHLGGALVGFILLKFGDTLKIYTLFDKMGSMFGRGHKNSSFQKRRKVYRMEPGAGDATPTPPWFRQATPEEPQPKSGEERLFEPTQEITQEQIDGILDKISRHGYNSLTDVEKQILYEASKKF